MAKVIIGHGGSGYFGTKMAPNTEKGPGRWRHAVNESKEYE